MPNKQLSCTECGSNFVFSERDQAFFEQKGFREPRRCPSCRGQRAGKPTKTLYTAYCAHGNHSVQVPFEVDASRPWICRDCKASKDASMFHGNCSDCGAAVRLPFTPDAGRPIYCKTCYQTRPAPPRRRPAGPIGSPRDKFLVDSKGLKIFYSALTGWTANSDVRSGGGYHLTPHGQPGIQRTPYGQPVGPRPSMARMGQPRIGGRRAFRPSR